MDPRRHVPRTDLVLADPRLVEARELLGDALVKKAVANAQDLARRGTISPASVADVAVSSLPPIATTLTPVINATGVIVHTNLGRAPLSAAAQEAGDLMSLRHKRGRPGELRDTMIAGIALATHATLATRNTAHFEDLSVLVVNPWVS